MSRKKSRTKTLAENREKRAKKIAIGGGVVLVALVAFQGRHLLSHSSSSTTPPPAVTTTSGVPGATPAPTPSTTPPGTAAVGVAALAVTPTASTKLPDSEAGPKEAKSQLFSFSRFTAKDPFVQQVSSTSPTGSSTTASSGTSAQHGPAGCRHGSGRRPEHHSAEAGPRAGGGEHGDALDQRQAPDGPRRGELPEREPALQARLAHPRRREDRHRERLLCERRSDPFPRNRPRGHARRHGGRHPLQAAADLRVVS